MRSIRIKNLRGLEDTGLVELKPITLLLGENSSGKSTFLRSFPLLRQSVEVRTKGPILWYGRLVDFGNFSNALSSTAEKESISLQFEYPLNISDIPRHHNRPFHSDDANTEPILFTLQMTAGKDQATRVERYVLEFARHHILIDFDAQGAVREFVVNGRNLSSMSRDLKLVGGSGLVSTLRFLPASRERSDVQQLRWLRTLTPFSEMLIDEVWALAHRNTSRDKISHLIADFGLGTPEKILQAMQHTKFATDTWRKNVNSWAIDDDKFKLILDLVIAEATIELLEMSDSYLSTFARNITYIAPLRATAERYYRFQDLAVDEVDFQGQNLAMFLRNLTEREQERFKDWMADHLGFIPRTRREGGHISIEIIEVESEKAFNLADMGFGFSQILPVVTQLWRQSEQRQIPFRMREAPVILAIEQPELHLHPRLQVRLVEAFVAAIRAAHVKRISLRLIIESHSETIVNHLGHLIANQRLDEKDINIVLFEREIQHRRSKIRLGGYDPEGFLLNWPYGFFEPQSTLL